MLIKIKKLINADISLEEENHVYVLTEEPNIKFRSVTDLTSQQFPPFEKELIAKTLVKRSSKYKNMTWIELIDKWDNAAKVGTDVHKELENYILNKINPKLKKAISGKDCLCNELYKLGDKYYPEVIVYSKELRLAGTIDLIIYNSKSNECYIFDWKTSKNIDIPSDCSSAMFFIVAALIS